MRYTKEQVTNIAGNIIKNDQITSNPQYQWIDIVGLPQRSPQLTDSLFFASHSGGEGGWDNGFDRRPYARKVTEDTGWHLATDPTFDAAGTQHLQVSSLEHLATSLYEAAQSENKPYVVGVTGSVGKTTTVAFLEHLIKTSGTEVTRFYSKRLTPLSVMCHFINRVGKETSVIVMEYSAYLQDHVGTLSQLLPPDIAFLVNVYDTHINEGTFKDRGEIFNSKTRIKPANGRGFLKKQLLAELNVPIPDGWNTFETQLPTLSNRYLPPTLRTSELFTVGKVLSDEMGISTDDFHQAYSTFVPGENRILVCNQNGQDIFFHGETSGGSRLWSWFETLDGTAPWFLVEEVDFADEAPDGFSHLLEKVFSSDKTIVLDTHLNRDRLPISAHFVNETAFQNILFNKAKGYVVYHKSLATRQPNFDPTEYLKKRW